MARDDIGYLVSDARHAITTADDLGLTRVKTSPGRGMEWVTPEGQRVRLCTSARSLVARPMNTRLFIGHGFDFIPESDQKLISELIKSRRFRVS